MNFYLKTMYNGNPDEAKVALTFDDGPDEETTAGLLNILEKHQIKAAFFCIGNKIEKNKSILKKISENGHLIGNHSWSHAFLFDFFLPGRMIREIKKTDTIIDNITGIPVKLFRPPYGVTNPLLSKALKKTGHTVIGWSLRTFDTTKNRQRVLKRIETQLKNGDIILFHDANPKTIDLLEDAIKLIKHRGMEIVGLNELLKINIKG
ncbi:MAG: polysaccharide deacetylase family protein [Bacteroidales bacterium]|nr:polysaccharide deacetylase family protein [Bacteroidales bacterium]